MFNFREELEKIKKEQPKHFFDDKAEEFLKEVLEKLKKLDYARFKQINSLGFSNREGDIRVTINNYVEALYSKPYIDLYRDEIFQAIRKTIEKTYPDISIHTSNFFIVNI